MGKIKKFYSRAELGMMSPRSVSRNITPQNGGAAIHYGGGAQGISSESVARARWIAWQRYHMVTRGWADIAYTAGFDNWGNVYAGRGLGVRTAANGTNHGNQNYLAFVWIGGGNEVPSRAAYDALDWLVQNARSHGAGLRVRPHSAFRSTSCPGRLLTDRSGDMDNRRTFPGVTAPDAPSTRTYITVGDKGPKVREWQELLIKWDSNALPQFGADGDFGNETRTWTLRFFDSVGISVSDRSAPRVGDNSFAAIRSAITPAADIAEIKAEVARIKRLLDSSKDSLIAQQQVVKDADAAVRAAKEDASRALAQLREFEALVKGMSEKLEKAQKALEDAISEEANRPKPEPEPEPKPEPEPETRNYLTLGDKGTAVVSWQRNLRKWNPASLPRFGADGDFGNETLEWTRRFQSSAGITVDGKVGPQTLRSMEKALSFRFVHTALIRRGDKGAAVTEWQQALRRWNGSSLPRFGADGDFGGETDDWTRRYQRAAGIGVDGIVGPQARSAMTRTLTS